MMLSCGHIYCNQCIQHQSQKETITCPLDDSCQQLEGFKLIPVKGLMAYLDKMSTVNINCDTHPHKMVKKYCKQQQKMLCNICQTDCNCCNEKTEHQNILRKDLEDYIEHKIPSLKSLLEKIQVLIHSLQQYQNKDKMFGASEFVDMMTQINKYLGQSLEEKSLFHFENQQNYYKNSKLENLEFIQILNKPKIPDLTQLILEKDKVKHFRGLVDYHLETLKNQQINGLPLNGQTKLLYQGTKDGFLASSFHQKCDNQGPTISFIQSEHEQVFGV
ncbi:tldc domain-containing protein [Stylonychia lemnae]|uniref:Tldc domain-containing protein n=1 Tax=Stylonychia lemnae TaxID=5949 RepID=A0A078B3G3_STYLE|nr:tldc domain-containing protein [Stylonychia lemnae]|eukprot:CDW88984.1 tldc domain-containing protein [Stylonychia lemnae]